MCDNDLYNLRIYSLKYMYVRFEITYMDYDVRRNGLIFQIYTSYVNITTHDVQILVFVTSNFVIDYV